MQGLFIASGFSGDQNQLMAGNGTYIDSLSSLTSFCCSCVRILKFSCFYSICTLPKLIMYIFVYYNMKLWNVGQMAS